MDDEITSYEPEQPGPLAELQPESEEEELTLKRLLAELKKTLHIKRSRQPKIPGGPLKDMMAVVKKWLYLEEDYTIIGPLCVAIANFCPGDPDMIGVIGPSGSTKTEFIRALGTRENAIVYPISSLTEHTLVADLTTQKHRLTLFHCCTTG